MTTNVEQQEIEALHAGAPLEDTDDFGRPLAPEVTINASGLPYSNECTITTDDYRLKDCLVVHFNYIEVITKSGKQLEGALLISYTIELDDGTEVLEEEWIPKKLCKNLIDNTTYDSECPGAGDEECTVLIWDKFLADAKPQLYARAIARSEEVAASDRDE